MKLLLLLLLGCATFNARADTAAPEVPRAPLGRSGEQAADQDGVAGGEARSLEYGASEEAQPENTTSIQLRWASGGYCARKKATGWFCDGATRVYCCRRAVLWQLVWGACESWPNWFSCKVGHSAAARLGTSGVAQAQHVENVTKSSSTAAAEEQSLTASSFDDLAGNNDNVSTTALTEDVAEEGEIGASAESRWVGGGFCASKRRWGWFCWGTTRVRCCKRGLFWTSCRSIAYWSGCRWRSNDPEMQEEEEERNEENVTAAALEEEEQVGNVTASEENPENEEEEQQDEENVSAAALEEEEQGRMESPESWNKDIDEAAPFSPEDVTTTVHV